MLHIYATIKKILKANIYSSHHFPCPPVIALFLFLFIVKLFKRLIYICLLQFMSFCFCFNLSNLKSLCPHHSKNLLLLMPNPMDSCFSSSYLIYQQLPITPFSWKHFLLFLSPRPASQDLVYLVSLLKI